MPHVWPQRDGQQDPGALQERPQSTTVRTGAGIMKPSKEMLPWLLSAFLCYDARQKYDVLNAQCTMKFILVYLWSSFEECEKFVTVQSSMAILNYEPRYPAVNQGFRKQRPGSSTRQRGSFRSWMTWVLWMTIKLQQVFFSKIDKSVWYPTCFSGTWCAKGSPSSPPFKGATWAGCSWAASSSAGRQISKWLPISVS